MARNSLTAALATFVTGTPATAKRRKSSRMETSLRGAARVDTIGTRKAQASGGYGAVSSNLLWQEQAWAYYRSVGECHYSANFVGNCLSRCTLTIGLKDSSGNVGPAFDEDGKPFKGEDGNVLPGLERAEEALQLVKELKGEVGGQSQFLRLLGINLAIAGECHLVGSGLSGPGGWALTPDVGAIQQWEILSTQEFKPQGEDYVRRTAPGATPVEVPGETVHVVRIWRQHPQFSELPDSSIEPVLDILEELQLLTREVRGEALSRLSNGKVLLLPSEIEWPDDELDDSSGEAGDPFTRDLVATMSTAISDKGSAAAIVPFVLRAPKELLDAIRTIDLSRTNPSDSSAKRDEAVRRFAQGIDLPVEITQGHAGTTFANAVVISDDTYKTHIEPILETGCDALTVGYLLPALGDPNSPLVVHYNSSELVSRPNRSQDAKDVHDRYALSDATLRASTGFSDNDAPSADELAERVEIKRLTSGRAGTASDAAEEQASQPAGTTAPGAPVEQGESTSASSDGPLAASAAEAKTVSFAIRMCAEITVERALKRAGARLRSQASKTAALREQLAQVPDAEVPVTLGPTWIAKISAKADLFSGEFDSLHSVVVRETNDRAYADDLRDSCERIAKERLFKPREPFPFDLLPDRHA